MFSQEFFFFLSHRTHDGEFILTDPKENRPETDDNTVRQVSVPAVMSYTVFVSGVVSLTRVK